MRDSTIFTQAVKLQNFRCRIQAAHLTSLRMMRSCGRHLKKTRWRKQAACVSWTLCEEHTYIERHRTPTGVTPVAVVLWRVEGRNMQRKRKVDTLVLDPHPRHHIRIGIFVCNESIVCNNGITLPATSANYIYIYIYIYI